MFLNLVRSGAPAGKGGALPEDLCACAVYFVGSLSGTSSPSARGEGLCWSRLVSGSQVSQAEASGACAVSRKRVSTWAPREGRGARVWWECLEGAHQGSRAWLWAGRVSFPGNIAVACVPLSVSTTLTSPVFLCFSTMGRKLDPTKKEKRGPGRKARKQKGAETELVRFLPAGEGRSSLTPPGPWSILYHNLDPFARPPSPAA